MEAGGGACAPMESGGGASAPMSLGEGLVHPWSLGEGLVHPWSLGEGLVHPWRGLYVQCCGVIQSLLTIYSILLQSTKSQLMKMESSLLVAQMMGRYVSTIYV